ncbi:MAG: hypothetical protein ACRD82_02895, partial [Blastocatellia bacterium]
VGLRREDVGPGIEGRLEAAREVLHHRERALREEMCVEAGARLTNCIVGDDVTIPAGAEFNHSVIVRADIAAEGERPEKALPAEVVGQNLVVKFG